MFAAIGGEHCRSGAGDYMLAFEETIPETFRQEKTLLSTGPASCRQVRPRRKHAACKNEAPGEEPELQLKERLFDARCSASAPTACFLLFYNENKGSARRSASGDGADFGTIQAPSRH